MAVILDVRIITECHKKNVRRGIATVQFSAIAEVRGGLLRCLFYAAKRTC